MIIRDVEDRDASIVKKYAQDFLEYYPVNIDYDTTELLKVLEMVSEQGLFLVAETETDGVIGGVGGLISPHFYAPMHLLSTEMFLWVAEEHRKSTVGPRLLKEFEKRSKEAGCKYIAMTSTVHTPNFKSYLDKKGYKEAETSFLKEI
jgi:GNAT superfamily N-acetyltransferase